MSVATFDIFFVEPGKDPRWMGAVQGLDEAQERMKRLADADPGRYFIYEIASASILATIDTTPPHRLGRKHRGAA